MMMLYICIGIVTATTTVVIVREPLTKLDIDGTKYPLDILYDMALYGSDFDFDNPAEDVAFMRNDESPSQPTGAVAPSETDVANTASQAVSFRYAVDIQEDDYARVAFSFREYLSLLAPLNECSYQKWYIVIVNKVRAKAGLPLHPEPPCQADLDPTRDLLYFPRMIKPIAPFYRRFFTDPIELAAYTEVARASRGLDQASLQDIVNMELLLKAFVTSARNLVETSNSIRLSSAQEKAQSYDMFMSAITALFDAKQEVYLNHIKAVVYSFREKKGLVLPDDPGVRDQRIDRFASAYERFIRSHGNDLKIPGLAKALAKVRSCNAVSSKHIQMVRLQTDPEQLIPMIDEAGRLLVGTFNAVFQLVSLAQRTEMVIQKIRDLLDQMRQLTTEDIRDHVRHFHVKIMEKVGEAHTYENEGRNVNRLVSFGKALVPIDTLKDVIFDGCPKILEAFGKVFEDHKALAKACRALKQSPQKELIPVLRVTMKTYIISLCKFLNQVKLNHAVSTRVAEGSASPELPVIEPNLEIDS